MFYEVPLYWGSRSFTVPNPGDLGAGWEMDSDLLGEAAQGYCCEEIEEADLPVPLDNPPYQGLRIFRLEGQNGPSYFGIIER